MGIFFFGPSRLDRSMAETIRRGIDAQREAERNFVETLRRHVSERVQRAMDVIHVEPNDLIVMPTTRRESSGKTIDVEWEEVKDVKLLPPKDEP